MQWCKPHWDQLRQAIENRGLTPFVAKSGSAAAAQLAEELKGTARESRPPDPLMRAHWMIVNRCTEVGGMYLFTGDYCPLCELEAHTPAKAADWIDPCCDSLLEYFREKQWIARAS